MAEILGTVLVALLIVAPLAWRNWEEQREDTALAVHARIRARMCQIFHGEPLLSIDVRPALPWRPGRVALSTPAGWEWIIEQAWSALLREVPPGYELVLQPRRPEVPGPVPVGTELRRAA